MAIRHLLESDGNNTRLTTVEAMTILRFYLNTVFIFDWKMHNLVKDTTKGSHISAISAKAVLQRPEKEELHRCPP